VPVGVQDIWQHLAIEPEEVVVLSAIYSSSAGGAELIAASLLAGPAEIATTGWPGWRLAEGFKPEPRGNVLDIPVEFTFIRRASLLVGQFLPSPMRTDGFGQCSTTASLQVSDRSPQHVRC
jgi:hypothetical protein